MENIAYHFTGDLLRDGSAIPAVGEKLIFDGEIKICNSGYHWSKLPSDALKYATGHMLHMVEYGGYTQEHDDKGCSVERTIIKTINAEYLLRRFAADQALSVSHLWDMPEIFKTCLTSLDVDLRAAAWDAAWDAARAAAWDAAWDAASDAARAAASDGASDAASAAARAAAWDAASAAAWAAAWSDFNQRVYAAFEETK